MMLNLPENNNNRTFAAGYNHQSFPDHQSRRHNHTKVQHLVIQLEAKYLIQWAEQSQVLSRQFLYTILTIKWLKQYQKDSLIYLLRTSSGYHIDSILSQLEEIARYSVVKSVIYSRCANLLYATLQINDLKHTHA